MDYKPTQSQVVGEVIEDEKAVAVSAFRLLIQLTSHSKTLSALLMFFIVSFIMFVF